MRWASLARLMDLAAQLEADARRDPSELFRRDRSIGRELAESGARDDALGAWLDRVRPGPGDGFQFARAQRALALVLALLGLGAGAATASALFYYDGTHPVNAVRVLAVFVVLQAGLLLGTGILALPEGLRRRVPGLSALQDVLALLSPGRWQAGLVRLLPRARRDAVERALGLVRSQRALYAEVQKWAVLVASQGFAAAFNVGALAAGLLLVAFTDLAFGWSTTLEVDPGALHRVTRTLAMPWVGWLPGADPSAELIAATQYFRGRPDDAADPAIAADWWPFLLLCMLVYGLAPRAVTWGLALWRLEVASRRAAAHLPGLALLRDRLEHHLVETSAETPEPALPERGPGPATRGPALPEQAPARLLNWSGFPLSDDEARRLVSEQLGLRVEGVIHVGGGRELAADAEAVRGMAETAEDVVAVVLVKAWEPPVLELLDFLGELRAALGASRPVAVLALGVDARGHPVPAEPSHALQWRRRLDTCGDPWLTLLGPAPEPA